VSAEDKYAIALAVLSIAIWGGGTILARWLSRSNPRIIRVVWPVVAVATLMLYAGFVLIARVSAHNAG